jgi:hypothetical protein
MTHKMLCTWIVVAGIGPFAPIPLAPSPTNQLCYNSPAYRNTHEQECVIDTVSANPREGGDGSDDSVPHRGLIGGLLHGLTGGLL